MFFAAVDGLLNAGPEWEQLARPARSANHAHAQPPSHDNAVPPLLWVRQAVSHQRSRAAEFKEAVIAEGHGPLHAAASDDDMGRVHHYHGNETRARPGPGGAVAFAPSPTIKYAQRTIPGAGPVGVLWCGGGVRNAAELRELYGLTGSGDNGAELLLDLYCAGFADSYGDDTDQPATALAAIQCSFSCVLLDSGARCLLAARSDADAPPLAWGSARDGTLLFAPDAESLRGLCERPAGGAVPFPAACFYKAADDDRAPTLASFKRPRGRRGVAAVPRLNSSGQLCALGFYSQSGTDLAGMTTGAGALQWPPTLPLLVGWRH